jgi:GT2 family glycosyltransferase
VKSTGFMQNVNKFEESEEAGYQSRPTESAVNQLILGNRWQQEEQWQNAIQAYAAALQANPLVSLPIVHLLERSRTGYQRERAIVLREQADAARLVRVIDPGGSQVKLNSTSTNGRHHAATLVLPTDHSDLVNWSWQQVASRPADGVLLQGISMPLVVVGMLYKVMWGAAILVDNAADAESPASLLTGISIDELKVQGNGLPPPQQLQREEWLRLAIDLTARFDGTLPSESQDQWQKALHQPRRPVDGAQLNCLEALAPALAGPLMAARYWRWNQERINWAELQSRPRDPDLVSIVIPVYGDPRELDECLHSLRVADSQWAWEVVAVMNDATERSQKVLAKHRNCDARVRGVWPGENLQFALGCNLGFAASQGRWLVLLNNDCRVNAGWLDGLIKPLLQDDAVAATQPRLIKPNGNVQSLGVVFHEGQTLGYPLYAGLPANLSCIRKPHRLQALTGACLAMRAQDFASVRGLDCCYINSQEDIDLCLRLLQIQGRRYCLSSDSSEVVHSEGRAPGRYGHSTWSRHQFVRRWAQRITPDDLSVYRADGVTISTFKPDKPEFERGGIGAGRAIFRDIAKTAELAAPITIGAT